MFELTRVRRNSLAVSGLSLTLLMAGLDASIANTSLPELARAYGASFEQAQWIVLAYLLAVTSLTVAAGRIGDVLGRRRVFLAGVGTFTLASLACALAPTLRWLVAARALQGTAAAGTTALGYALIGDIRHAGTGRAMGRLAAASAVGTTLGPAIGGMVGHFAPSAIFLVNVPLGALAFVLAARFVPKNAPCVRRTVAFDAAGTLLLAVSLLAYALSMTRSGAWHPANGLLLGAALFGSVAFAAVESRTPSPLVPVAMFRNTAFSSSLASSAIVATVVTATLIVGPFYLTRSLGLGRAQAGLVLSLGPAAAALVASLAGLLIERHGPARVVVAGLSVMAAGSSLLALRPASAGTLAYAGPLVVMTSGYAMFQTANNTTALAEAGSGRRGVGAGLLTLSRNFGQITGASVIGALFLHATGATALSAARPEAIAVGMRTTLAVSTALIASALALVVVSRRQSVPVTQPLIPNVERSSSC